MGVVPEALHKLPDILVDEGMEGDVVRPFRQLRRRRQVPVHDQEGGLQVGALLGQLLDRVTPVLEHTGIAIDEGDLAPARGRVGKCRVVHHQPEVFRGSPHAAVVHRPKGAILDRYLIAFSRAVVDHSERLSSHATLLVALSRPLRRAHWRWYLRWHAMVMAGGPRRRGRWFPVQQDVAAGASACPGHRTGHTVTNRRAMAATAPTRTDH